MSVQGAHLSKYGIQILIAGFLNIYFYIFLHFFTFSKYSKFHEREVSRGKIWMLLNSARC